MSMRKYALNRCCNQGCRSRLSSDEIDRANKIAKKIIDAGYTEPKNEVLEELKREIEGNERILSSALGCEIIQFARDTSHSCLGGRGEKLPLVFSCIAAFSAIMAILCNVDALRAFLLAVSFALIVIVVYVIMVKVRKERYLKFYSWLDKKMVDLLSGLYAEDNRHPCRKGK